MINISKPKINYVFILNSIFLIILVYIFTFKYLKIYDICKLYLFFIIIYYFFSSIYSLSSFENLKRKIFKSFFIVFFSLSVLLFFYCLGVLIVIKKIDLLIINFLDLLFLIMVLIYGEIVARKQKKYNFLLISNTKQNILTKKLILQLKNKINKIVVTSEDNFQNQLSFYDDIDYYILASDVKLTSRQRIISLLLNANKKIFIMPGIDDLFLVDIKAARLVDELCLQINDFTITKFQSFFKRLIDLVFSILVLIIFLPLFIVIVILIKIFDTGPIFYYQKRLTINRKEFILIKFRTMVVNAEENTGAIFSSENDTRITKIGKILRASRLDELPQIINIIKGDMSVVGPRPERAYFVNRFLQEEPLYAKRFNVKAGITGLSQINVNYNSSYKDKLGFDLLYINKYSFYLDVKIVFNTLMVICNPASSTGNILDISLEELLEKNKFNIDIENEQEIVIFNEKKYFKN